MKGFRWWSRDLGVKGCGGYGFRVEGVKVV